MNVADPAFRERFLDALAADREFEQEARWFGGSILLGCGDQILWLPATATSRAGPAMTSATGSTTSVAPS